MTFKVIGAFLSVFGFSIILEVPKKFVFLSACIGAFGWFIYLNVTGQNHSAVTGTFVAAIFIALISHCMARLFKSPVTVFLIAGILPLVPGKGMYDTVYEILKHDMKEAGNNFTETIMIAGAIALAFFIMDAIFRYFRPKVKKS